MKFVSNAFFQIGSFYVFGHNLHVFYMSAQPPMLIKFYKQRKCGADSFISEEALTKPKYK